MNFHLVLLVCYSAVLLGVGLAVSRRVRSASSFFVANRSLGAALLFSTVLAANIGAGSTVGATGIAYRDGLSAWWWNGSAGIGSLLLAFWIGPRVWRQATQNGFLTAGDLVEHHFGRSVRGVVSSMLWFATLSILAGQLIGIAWILNVVAGMPKWVGCLIGGGLLTTYFAAGGLLGAAWVNVVQLMVKLVGFAIALPFVISNAGGLDMILRQAPGAIPDAGYGAFWHGTTSIGFVVLMVPAFVSSPGLLQKIYGARSDRAVRIGIGVNAVMLMLFGFVPALLGMAARLHHPGLARELALPTLLVSDLPVGVGGLLLAASFSAEVSAADAVLFMLSTSLSQDLYRRFINRSARDSQVLGVARLAAVVGGALGILVAIVTPTIEGALSFFYAMLGATVLIPVLVATHAHVDRRREVLVSILAGAAGVVVTQLWGGIRPGSLWTPATVGVLSAGATYLLGVTIAKIARNKA
ncbi:MAG: sodium:solute symporter family protein [Acidobacteria bacterium]|nr:sodium:solute symporter family protein [Acidobacteriota bacterium]